MLFILLLLISFIVGILACMPLAPYISPPTFSLIVILFSPWIILSLFSQHPIINEIRSMYLSFIFGMCAYWTYYETIKKLKGGGN